MSDLELSVVVQLLENPTVLREGEANSPGPSSDESPDPAPSPHLQGPRFSLPPSSIISRYPPSRSLCVCMPCSPTALPLHLLLSCRVPIALVSPISVAVPRYVSLPACLSVPPSLSLSFAATATPSPLAFSHTTAPPPAPEARKENNTKKESRRVHPGSLRFLTLRAARRDFSSDLAPVQTIFPEAKIRAVVLGSRMRMMTAAKRCAACTTDRVGGLGGVWGRGRGSQSEVSWKDVVACCSAGTCAQTPPLLADR